MAKCIERKWKIRMENKRTTIVMIIAGYIISHFSVFADADSGEKKSHDIFGTKLLTPDKTSLFKPVVSMETWTTYSIDERVKGVSYDNRGDISFRRFRFGGCGTPYSWLKYAFQLHLDRLGEDSYAATKGSYGGLDIWNAYISAKLLNKSDLLHFHAGYYWAAISREFNTSPWAVGSFDKTRANWYLRNFVTGKGNGIESGFGLGGCGTAGLFGIGYRIGTYEPAAYRGAENASRLYTGRLTLSAGDPELKKYKFMVNGNQWGKTIGVTAGIGISTQSDGTVSDSVSFRRSSAYGTDLLVTLKGLRMEGEYFILDREAAGFGEFNGTEWHIRIGYTFAAGVTFIEPSICFDHYNGEGRKSLFKFIGEDRTFDAGVNWYLNSDKLKLSLHYIVQDGNIGTNTGNYAGAGLQVRL